MGEVARGVVAMGEAARGAVAMGEVARDRAAAMGMAAGGVVAMGEVARGVRGGSRIFRRGGLTTARGNGVCPLPRKAEKFLPLLFVTKN